MELETKTVKYPAPYLAHWVTGAVACCEEHCNGIVGLGKFMGSVVPVSENTDESLECENCINEAKK
jgi:hypothetical protein